MFRLGKSSAVEVFEYLRLNSIAKRELLYIMQNTIETGKVEISESILNIT